MYGYCMQFDGLEKFLNSSRLRIALGCLLYFKTDDGSEGSESGLIVLSQLNWWM